jgi:hypothetical protein
MHGSWFMVHGSADTVVGLLFGCSAVLHPSPSLASAGFRLAVTGLG